MESVSQSGSARPVEGGAIKTVSFVSLPQPSLLALERALIELEEEGGIAGCHGRYLKNHARLLSGMRGLGSPHF